MEKTVRVGMMPGRIEEFVVEAGTPISNLLEMAGLNASGFDVKVDGVKVENLNSPITASTNLILLVKQIKGNAEKTVRVGMMPGRISEFAVSTDNTIADVLAIADLNSSGFDVKVDGVKIDNLSTKITSSTNLILLVKQIKGNN